MVLHFQTAEPHLRSPDLAWRLIRRLPVVFFQLDPLEMVLQSNGPLFQATGYTIDELQGQRWIDMLFPGDLRLAARAFYQAIKTGDVSGYKLTLVQKNGNKMVLEVSTANVYQVDGSLEKIAGVGIDITQRRQTGEGLSHSLEEYQVQQEELRSQNEELLRIQAQLDGERRHYHELFEYGPNVYLVTDENGIILEANQAAAGLFQMKRQQLTGKALPVLIAPKRRRDFRALLNHLKEDPQTQSLESELTPGEGISYQVALIVSPVKKEQGRGIELRWLIYDLTERKAAERALCESEERYRLVLESVKDYAIFTMDTEGFITSWNPGAESIKGYTKEEILGQHFSQFYTPEDRRRELPQHALTQAAAEGRFEMEGWRVRKDGNRFWASVVISPMLDASGQLRGFCKVVRNMSRRMQMEAELAELQRRLMDGREAERVQLARELHDGPAQDLYGISFNFKAFCDALPDGVDKQAAQVLQEGIHQVTRTLRQITSELRPPTLAPLGLEKAIRSHAEIFSESFPGLDIILDLEPDGQNYLW